MEQLLSIGEFAERCGLSRSALRFYDQNGLLRPQVVDEETGYRYYGNDQLAQALLVRQLRQAEVPVGVLRQYLAASAARRREILDAHAASFRQRAAGVESAVGRLRDELDRARSGRWCEIAPAVLSDGLAQVSFALADPAVRAELGSVWVESKDQSLRLVATDSYRLAVRDLVPERVGPEAIRAVVDGAQAGRLIEALTGPATAALTQSEDGELQVTLDGRRSRVGGPGEGFPDYERILTELPAGHQIALARPELERALDGLPDRAEVLVLRFGAGRLGLEADGGHASVAGDWEGPELTVRVNPRFLTEAVAATVGPDVILEAVDPLEPVTVRCADTGTFSVLTMPIRPPGSA